MICSSEFSPQLQKVIPFEESCRLGNAELEGLDKTPFGKRTSEFAYLRSPSPDHLSGSGGTYLNCPPLRPFMPTSSDSVILPVLEAFSLGQ
jgi:hypothetical protein